MTTSKQVVFLYPNIMELELPFKIGEQYELYEFELNDGKVVKKNGLEFIEHRFTTKSIIKYNLKHLHNLRLYFNADILAIIQFEIDILKFKFDRFLISKLTEKGTQILFSYFDSKCQILITHYKYKMLI